MGQMVGSMGDGRDDGGWRSQQGGGPRYLLFKHEQSPSLANRLGQQGKGRSMGRHPRGSNDTLDNGMCGNYHSIVEMEGVRGLPRPECKTAVESEVRRMTTILQDTVLRYKAGLFPLAATSYAKLMVTERIRSKWAGAHRGDNGGWGQDETVRLGSFDGGSRGYPGPGGSGRLIVEWTRRDESPRLQLHV